MNIQILAHEFYDYSLYVKGYSKDTIQRYRSVIRLYCNIANVSTIEEVTSKNVRDAFYYGRVHKKWKSNTFITFQQTLLVFFRWCKGRGYIAFNPAEDIEKPKLEKRLPPKLTKQEANKLLEIVYNYPYESNFLRYRNHALFSLALHAGLRKGELLNLRYTDVDIENLSIFIHQGKGAKDRILPIGNTLAHTLSRYITERKRLKKTCAHFFVSFQRNTGLTDTGVRNLVALLRKCSGIQFSMHKLRHTFATLMLEGGCDIYSLSKMMGHSDIKTTTIYLAASAEHLRLQMTKHPMNEIRY